MSNPIKGTQVVVAMMAWWVPVAVAGVAVVAVISYIRSQETHAASGSPLYGKAVKEAIEGLKNPGAKAVVARPPLAAGLSPDEHYWCEQCKAYHKRQPGQAPPAAGATPPPVAGGIPDPLAVPPAAQPGGQAAAVIPPLPAGLDPAEHYWCPNCKTYHKRESAQPKPEAWRGVPYKLNLPPAIPATVPAIPSAPSTPATPAAPVTPAVPGAPIAPATPVIPPTPVIPSPPAPPVKPETPVAPGTNPPATPPLVPPASGTSGK
jgi:hypothetical protein